MTADTNGRQLLAAKTDMKITTAAIEHSNDSIRTTLTKTFYTDGLAMTENRKDTVYAFSEKHSVKPDVKVSKILGYGGYWKMVFLVFIMILYVTMVYGPIAAFLVELFPTKIRYTSMSLPYHIGNGVFGGLTPFIATLLTTIYTSDKLVGLNYPIWIAGLSLVIGALYLGNKIDSNVTD
jgi:hypothetical protein